MHYEYAVLTRKGVISWNNDACAGVSAGQNKV